MSDNTTSRWLKAYDKAAELAVTMFFSGFFRSPEENFHDSEFVEFDYMDASEDIAIVITDLSTGARMNSTELFQNNRLKPPVLQEAISLSSFELLQRQFGKDPFASREFRTNVIMKLMRGMGMLQQKINRTIELQASQIFQTGVILLTDTANNLLYTIDFGIDSSHFPTASVVWDQALSTKIEDIDALADVNIADGLLPQDQLIFGDLAWEAWLKDDEVKDRLNLRRADLGMVSPIEIVGAGGKFRGTVDIGSNKYDMWTYNGRYKDPVTGLSTKYLDPGKVIVRASTGRMDATFGLIPNFNQMTGEGQLFPELPSRFSIAGRGMDMSTNIYKTANGSQLIGEVGTRPLLFPVAKGTFGCLDTGL